jgi:hypothetical protein
LSSSACLTITSASLCRRHVRFNVRGRSQRCCLSVRLFAVAAAEQHPYSAR